MRGYCNDCEHFMPDIQGSTLGICVRYAPKPLTLLAIDREALSHDAVWPTVTIDATCGEFKIYNPEKD